MSVSRRHHRAAIYAYANTGVGGRTVETYVQQPSSAGDKCVWASLTMPRGTERTVALKAEERVDAVIGFDGHTAVAAGNLIVIGGITYRALAVLAREHGRDELQVLAMAAIVSTFTLQAAP